MFLKLIGSEKYRIDENGTIIDYDGKEVFTGESKIALKYNSRSYLLDREWLRLTSIFELDKYVNFEKLVNNVVFELVHSNNLRVKNLAIPRFNKPIYYSEKFRVIPAYPRYAIDLDCNIIDLADNSKVNKYLSKGYETTSIWSPDKRETVLVKVHRLLMMAWKPSTNYSFYHFINHKDGVKNNNHLSNLEWCTQEENNLHAVRMGLIAQSKAVKIRNYKTGEIKYFPSMSELGRTLGLGERDLNNLEYKLPGYLYKKLYEVKYADDDSQWFYENPYVYGAGSKSVVTIFTIEEDNIKRTFLNRDVFVKYYKLTSRINSIEGFINAFKSKYPGFKIEYKYNASKGPYIVFNVKTHETSTVNSIPEISKLTGIKRNELQYDLSINAKFIYKSEWLIAMEDKFDIADYREKNYRVIPVLATYPDGSCVNFNSIKEAARELKMDAKSIMRALKNNTKYKDIYFKAL